MMSDMFTVDAFHFYSLALACVVVVLVFFMAMSPRTIGALQDVCQFLSADAFERRARQRERSRLIAELNEMDQWRVFYNCREPRISARLQVLAREDGYRQ